jgi:hypothetical protein
MVPFLLPWRTALLRAVIPVGSVIWIACESTGPRTPGSLTLSVTTTPPGRAAVTRGTGPNSLRITNVEFVLAQTEISRAASCSTTPASDSCHALALDPLLIDLPLSAAPPRKVLDAIVSAGTYTGLQSELHAVQSNAALRAARPDWPAGVSVRVVGVYTDPNGVAHDFTFTSAADAELRMAFAQPVTVDGTTQNVTIAVDVARWFTNARGTVIDPRNSANAAAINANIRNSFQAFQDDDEDGVSDDGNEVEDDSTEVDDDSTDVDDDDEDEEAAELSTVFRP